MQNKIYLCIIYLLVILLYIINLLLPTPVYFPLARPHIFRQKSEIAKYFPASNLVLGEYYNLSGYPYV